jgi:hypothetical protein
MFQRRLINNIEKLFSIICILLILLCGTQAIYSQKRVERSKPEKVKGKVFARINLFTYGSGVGPRYQSFIYQINSSKDNGEKQTQLVRVIYQFFDMKDRLSKSFFDFSKEYELLLDRDTSCDEAPSDFGYQRTGEADNRVSILKLLTGTDKALLQENQTMPCYVLKSSNFR